MKTISRSLFFAFTLAIALTAWGNHSCQAKALRGSPAPEFSLSDIQGRTYDLTSMKDQPMVILYFFDADSRSSQEGLISMDRLAKNYKDANLKAWGITLSSKKKAAAFVSRTKPDFPILLDRSGVSDIYHAKMILPTVAILGPGLKVLDVFQGGGKTMEMMMVSLAGRTLQRKQTMLAKAISTQVEKKYPRNASAKAIKAYAALKDGELGQAKTEFENLARQKGHGGILGMEGLAAVYAKNGNKSKALKMIKAVEKKSPGRSYAHVIKGNILYSQNKKAEAAAEYQAAIQKNKAEPYQTAVAYNQLGRYYADKGKYNKSRQLYDQAVAIDPYYIEATSNKGVTYEKQGNWDQALKSYRKALFLDKTDSFAAVLAKKAQAMIESQRDIAKKKRIDKLVNQLVARFHGQVKSSAKPSDTWTSRPMVMTFVDFQEKGGLAERDGLSTVLTTQLGNALNASGRVRVVERVLVERLLEELNLGSSELADPETALKLGRVLAAKIIGTGSLFYMPDSTLLNIRFIDTETSAIPKVITEQISSSGSMGKEINKINREIIKSIIRSYPLKGFLVQVEKNKVMINLGSNQGVVLGTRFDVIEDQAPVKYKGKLLQSLPKKVGCIEVTQVNPDLCYAKIISRKRLLKRDDKIKEKMENLLAMKESHENN